jgi:hypothetical protein
LDNVINIFALSTLTTEELDNRQKKLNQSIELQNKKLSIDSDDDDCSNLFITLNYSIDINLCYICTQNILLNTIQFSVKTIPGFNNSTTIRYYHIHCYSKYLNIHLKVQPSMIDGFYELESNDQIYVTNLVTNVQQI